jgi:tRNA pseudouridine38-40 synthase
MGRPVGSRREARGTAPHLAGDGLISLRLTVAYDGSAFCGFQWQPVVRTIAGTLEAALLRLFSQPVKIAGAGRTDAGVHATGQVISFAAPPALPFERLAAALNAVLPADLSVRDAAIVPPDFSARFNARERTYVYVVYNRRERSALLTGRAYHVWSPLELEPMRRAASHLLGEHDFRAFCATPPQNGVTVRRVRRLAVAAAGDVIRIEIAADGFLHRMVRTIVGTLIECGRGTRDPGELPAIVQSRRRERAGLTAPPHGLYLAGVRYDGYDSYREPLV